MAKIGDSVVNPETHFTLNSLEYKKGSWELYYSGRVNKVGTKEIDVERVKVGLRNTYDINRILQSPIEVKNWFDLSGGSFNTLGDLLSYIVPIINFKLDTKIGLAQKVENFGELVSGAQEGDLAYVEESQGTLWLPSTVGGTYYPKGWYVWNGSQWVSDRNAIANQLENNVLSNSQALSEIASLAVRVDNIEQDESWGYYATNIQYTDLTGTIPTGQVLTGEIDNTTVYRFISTEQTGLYPTEDSFYATFDGTSLSDLITTR